VKSFPLENAALSQLGMRICGGDGNNQLPIVLTDDVADAMAGLSTCLASKASPTTSPAPLYHG